MPVITYTERDSHILRTVFFLLSEGEAVGPAKLARALDINRVTAMQAMRRLADLGYGEYIPGSGLILNKTGRDEVEESIWRHHVLERLMTESLGIPCSDACSESSRIQFSFSDEFLKMAFEKMGEPDNCDCGCSIKPPYTRENLTGCGWCREMMKV